MSELFNVCDHYSFVLEKKHVELFKDNLEQIYILANLFNYNTFTYFFSMSNAVTLGIYKNNIDINLTFFLYQDHCLKDIELVDNITSERFSSLDLSYDEVFKKVITYIN